MSRTKTETLLHPAPIVENPAIDDEIRHELTVSAKLEMQEHLEAGIAIGRMDSAQFWRCVADSTVLASYENIKKTKAWKYSINGDGRQFEDFDEFCQERYGKSYRRMRELLADRNLLGQELFEQAEKIGLRQIDYNAIKALPAPRQEIVKEALSAGATKEDLQQAIQQLAADTQKEIDALAAQVAETKADLEARGQLLSDKNRKIDELLVRTTPAATVNWPEQYQGFVAQVQVIRNTLKQSIANLEAVRLTVMQTMPPEARPVAEQTAEDDLLHNAIETVAVEISDTLDVSEKMLCRVRLNFDNTLSAFDRALGVKE